MTITTRRADWPRSGASAIAPRSGYAPTASANACSSSSGAAGDDALSCDDAFDRDRCADRPGGAREVACVETPQALRLRHAAIAQCVGRERRPFGHADACRVVDHEGRLGAECRHLGERRSSGESRVDAPDIPDADTRGRTGPLYDVLDPALLELAAETLELRGRLVTDDRHAGLAASRRFPWLDIHRPNLPGDRLTNVSWHPGVMKGAWRCADKLRRIRSAVRVRVCSRRPAP